MPRSKVLLCEDHRPTLARIRELLEEEFEVVAAVCDGESAALAASEYHPDALVFDISVPGISGLEAARRVLRRQPATKVIFLTNHREPYIVKEALALGATGYVLKTVAAEELLEAVRTALNGGIHVSSAVQQPRSISPPTP